ncbi:hypothetical protein [Serratia ureilytica]|uniref:hypothetical protein n=1 Tax=Serratia ureilytica TaxID=300181 RepID=UPI00370FD35A
MYTIFLDGKPGTRATGMGDSEFVDAFEDICKGHVQEKRARAFAFIFYNMNDGVIRNALKSARGFEILNAQTAHDLTLFYLHSNAIDSYAENFNQKFMETLNISEQAAPPCIVFFRVNEEEIVDIAFESIDDETTDEHLIVEELRRNIAKYIDGMNAEGNYTAITSVYGWIAKTAFTQGLRQLFRL